MVTTVSLDEFYDSDALTTLLLSWSDECPDLMHLSSIGQSWQGRDIWLVTVTDTRTGPASEKPGFSVEANIHAAELTSSCAALHLIHRLLSGYGTDPRITRLLRTRTMYVVPRLCPDGAEEVLREGRYVRSSLRPYPVQEPEPGLHPRDVDGDGRVLFMRLPDPYGPWKLCPDEPRLLVRREPDEEGGEYYRLLLEGEVVGYDGATVPMAAPFEGLDLATNFNSDWAELPGRPRDAGPFAGSEPEIHALLRAVVDRPNITGYVSCHSFGAVHLRPPLNDDDDLPMADLRRYEEFGAKATSLTGYAAMSYHELKHEPYRVRGGQLGWLYHERGLYAWITELWNPLRAAGVSAYHPSRWLLDHPVEEALRLIRWSDEELGGRGFVNWYPFDHPQLGKVELGGWDIVNYWYNPPRERIEAEVAPHSEWLIFHALASPLLEVASAFSEHLAPGVHRVRLVVANAGWLPTYVTDKALQRGESGSLSVELVLPAGARLVGGRRRVEHVQLEGRSDARTSATWWGHNPGTPDLAAFDWVVEAPVGTVITACARHPRAGVARAQICLSS